MSTIIFLNGCSSAGKTTLAKALQHIGDRPWILLGIDTFIAMMPDKYWDKENAHEGFSLIPGQNERGPTMDIKTGPFAESFLTTGAKVIGMLADSGHDLIVDEVLFKDDHRYREILANHTVYLVQVVCELSRMQEREILRGDRRIGFANTQSLLLYNAQCDLTVDTTSASSFTLAHTILDFIEKHPKPRGFN